MVSLNVEPAVTKLTYDVVVTGKDVQIENMETYGIKALFYINVDSAPKSKISDSLIEGSAIGPYSFTGFDF